MKKFVAVLLVLMFVTFSGVGRTECSRRSLLSGSSERLLTVPCRQLLCSCHGDQ